MIKYKLYLYQNTIQIKSTSIIIKQFKSIQDSQVINSNQFIKEFKTNFKKGINFFLPKLLTIYLNSLLNEMIIQYYTSLFEEFNFFNIKIISITTLLNNKNTIIEDQNYYYYIDSDFIKIPYNLSLQFIPILNKQKLKYIGSNKLPISNYYTYQNPLSTIIKLI